MELIDYARIAAIANHTDQDNTHILSDNWNPLESDADAFDLMLRCMITIEEYEVDDYHGWTVLLSGDTRWYDGDAWHRVDFYGKAKHEEIRSLFREGIFDIAGKIGLHYVNRGYYKDAN